MKLLLFHFFTHFHIQNCQVLMQTGSEPFGACWPSTLGTDSWQKKDRAVCVMDGRTARSLSRPIPSILSYIEDSRTVAHTQFGPKRQGRSFSSHLNTDAAGEGRRKRSILTVRPLPPN